MSKIFLLVILFLIFFTSSAQAAKINPTNYFDYNMCHYCPVLPDHPDYGPGKTMTCPDERADCANDNRTQPLGTSWETVTSPFCLYQPPEPAPGIPNYLTQGSEMNACTGANECNEPNGCGTSNPNPDQCLDLRDDECESQDRCKKGGQCSSYWCVNAAGNLYAEGQSAPGTCRFSNEKPLPGEFGDCTNADCPTGYTCSQTKICVRGRALQQNSPLSLPCAKNGTSYSDAKGCLKIKTALGNVRTDSAGFTRWMLGFVLSISGGIVIIIIIVAGYKLMTSQGDPEKVKNARDQLTAAIVGLLFIIFSLALLELITRDILGLPGFGS